MFFARRQGRVTGAQLINSPELCEKPRRPNVGTRKCICMLIRYLSKEKFEWLLCDQGIYVGAASTQSDKNEGIYDSTLISRTLSAYAPHISKIIWPEFDQVTKHLMLSNRENCYISSWYSGDGETRKMWDEYGNDGVAVISDEALLIHELPKPIGNASSFYKVQYCDNKKSSAINEPLKFKEEAFCHESEFRLVVNMSAYSLLTGFEAEKFGIAYVGDVPSYESKDITCCTSPEVLEQSHRVIRKKGDGYVVAFDLQKIIREVRLHPDCSNENELRIAKCLGSAGLNIAIQRSALSAPALSRES